MPFIIAILMPKAKNGDTGSASPEHNLRYPGGVNGGVRNRLRAGTPGLF